MSDNAEKERPAHDAWLAGSLRLTAFPVGPIQINNINWWSDLVGKEPESKTSRVRAGEHEEVGQFEDRSLILAVRPSRVDWLLAPQGEPQRFGELATVGTFSEALAIFQPLMRRWLENAPSIQRLAFGATLLQPVTGRKEGYERLSSYLPAVSLDPENSSDFSYQINRARASTSGIDGLRINRLSKWSAMALKTVDLTLTPESLRPTAAAESYACRLELDVNTTGDFQGELPKVSLSRILDELINLGAEIAAKGDIE